jgi:hypothetical protein
VLVNGRVGCLRDWKEEAPGTDLWQMICHLTNLVDRLVFSRVFTLQRDGAVTSCSRHSSDFPMQWRVTSSIFSWPASPERERHGAPGWTDPFWNPRAAPFFSLAKVAPPTRTTAPKVHPPPHGPRLSRAVADLEEHSRRLAAAQ